MKILVLGGTAFVGRTIVEIARAQGHELTLFNRGQRNPSIFTDLEQIHGDRLVDLSGLNGRTWDAVIDSSGYVPRALEMSTTALKDQVEHYLFISTISVYKNLGIANQTEDAELATVSDPTTEEVNGETYGGLKVLCEEVVAKNVGDRSTIVRPGLIIGPSDYTDRFSYWPIRMAEGGDVLVPDIKDQPIQAIDARDLGEWCLYLLENKILGTYSATAPYPPLTFEGMMNECAAGTDANLVWVSREFLEENEVKPWADLPMVLAFDGSSNGMLQIDTSKAKAHGLKTRTLSDTIRDLRAWAATRGTDYVLKAGLSRAKESELLLAWSNR